MPRYTTPRTAAAAVVVALALGALLNGPGLVAAATSLEVGAVRTAAMGLATLVSDTGASLRMDGPHRWLTDRRNRGLELLGAEATEQGAQLAAASGGAGVGVTEAQGVGEGEAGAEDPAGVMPAPAVAGLDHDRVRRPISAEQPLDVLFAGDSLIGSIADGFGRLSQDQEPIRWTKDVRISTGLARPDVLDWPRHLAQLVAERDPDVVVLMLGGNDDQSLTGGPDGVIHLGQDGWEAEYERRVGELLAVVAGQDRLVVWLGLPAMRPDRLERTRPVMGAATQRAVAGTPVVLLDTAPIVSPDGYTLRLDGVQIRAQDGVHLTHDGGDQVAVAIDELLRDRYALPEG